MLQEGLALVEDFIRQAWPGLEELLIFVPTAALISWAGSRFASWLKVIRKWRTAYTRKVFHFIIFTAASLLQMQYGLSAVVVLGVVTSFFVLRAVVKGEKSNFFLALARPGDAPRQKLFILVPLCTTALGGILANLFFGPFASIGYLVGGWGDAVGEPVGAAWGRHRYKVRSLGGVAASRSLEGSAAVFVVSWLVAFAGLFIFGLPAQQALAVGLACAFGGTLVEAFSSHGLDNLSTQVAASGIAYGLAG